MSGFVMINDPFSFNFTDDLTDQVVLSSSAFIMMDKYIQLDFNLPSRRIFGLGERKSNFTLGEGTWTMWASGQEMPADYGYGGKQSFGVHPFIMVQTAVVGQFFGVYFRNTNAMSPVIQYTGENTSALSFITTGGQLEIYFMFKGSPNQIIRQYQNIVGKPSLVPMWALGWHIASSFTQSAILQNMATWEQQNMPLEAFWV